MSTEFDADATSDRAAIIHCIPGPYTDAAHLADAILAAIAHAIAEHDADTLSHRIAIANAIRAFDHSGDSEPDSDRGVSTLDDAELERIKRDAWIDGFERGHFMSANGDVRSRAANIWWREHPR